MAGGAAARGLQAGGRAKVSRLQSALGFLPRIAAALTGGTLTPLPLPLSAAGVCRRRCARGARPRLWLRLNARAVFVTEALYLYRHTCKAELVKIKGSVHYASRHNKKRHTTRGAGHERAQRWAAFGKKETGTSRHSHRARTPGPPHSPPAAQNQRNQRGSVGLCGREGGGGSAA